MYPVKIEPLDVELSVCKVTDYTQIALEHPFVFSGSTDEEKSLVCPTDLMPENILIREDGWRAFRISGQLDFSLVGILAQISKTLADAGIGIFAVSTYNTDYILVKAENYSKALELLQSEKPGSGV